MGLWRGRAPNTSKKIQVCWKENDGGFLSKSGIIKTVMLEHQKNVTAKWYTETCLPQLMETLSNLRPRSRMDSWILHHDNVPAHRAHATIDYLKKVGIKVLSHPPYRPDLAPCDFGLFPFIKMQLKGRKFATHEQLIAGFEEVCSEIPKEKWEQWFSDWFVHMNKCIDRGWKIFWKIVKNIGVRQDLWNTLCIIGI